MKGKLFGFVDGQKARYLAKTVEYALFFENKYKLCITLNTTFKLLNILFVGEKNKKHQNTQNILFKLYARRTKKIPYLEPPRRGCGESRHPLPTSVGGGSQDPPTTHLNTYELPIHPWPPQTTHGLSEYMTSTCSVGERSSCQRRRAPASGRASAVALALRGGICDTGSAQCELRRTRKAKRRLELFNSHKA